MGQQNCAGRLARADDPDVDAARRSGGPARVVLPDVAAVLGPTQTGQVSPNKSIAVLRVQFTKPVDELAASTKDSFTAIGAPAQH